MSNLTKTAVIYARISEDKFKDDEHDDTELDDEVFPGDAGRAVRRQIRSCRAFAKDQGITIVPTRLYIAKNGFAKLEIALAKGKKTFDKRESIKERDVKRDMDIGRDEVLISTKVGVAPTSGGAREGLSARVVEREANALLANATEQARRQGQQVGAGVDAFREAARKRVLVALLVAEVARRNELRLDPARLNETMQLIASTYEQPQQVIDLYRNDPQLMQGLQNRVMEEQVIDWIAERATHTEQALSFQEAIGQ